MASLRALVTRRANVNARNADGQTPVFCASRRNRTEAVGYLVAAGADINAKGDCFVFVAAAIAVVDDVPAVVALAALAVVVIADLSCCGFWC